MLILFFIDPPKQPYILFNSRRIDDKLSISVKENSELNLTCACEYGNPKPILTWDLLLSPGAERHNQKSLPEDPGIEEIKQNPQVKYNFKQF